MRRVLGLLVICVAASASAHPHAQVTFAVAHGGEGLGYFAPEVARTVAHALEASAGEGDLVVVGKLEDIGAERVRLSATLHGRSASVEGTVESIDASAAQLASRLLAFVGDASPIKDAKEAAHAPKGPDRNDRKVAAAPARDKAPPVEHPADPPHEKAEPAEKFSDPTTTPAGATSTAPSGSGVGSSSPSGQATNSGPSTTPAGSSASSASTSPSGASTSAPSGSSTAPSGPATVASGPTTSTVQPVSTVSTTAPNPYPGYRYARNRVVVHTVPESPSAFVGSGTAATQALYAFLGRRLGLQVVPIGLGMTTPRVAADEGWRAGARAVVMARLESVDYQAAPTGATIRCRLEVVVVREGRVALRRVVESAPTPMPTGARGGRGLDPVFIAVSQSLEALAPDLNATFADLR